MCRYINFCVLLITKNEGCIKLANVTFVAELLKSLSN